MSTASDNTLSISRTLAWTVWLIASIFYAYQYVLRVMPNIMMDQLLDQFQINAATFGQLSGVYYLGYALIHIPIGILLDRFGPKKVLPACMLLTSIGLLPILFAHHWLYPMIGRTLIGIGSSAAILGAFKIIRLTFQEAQFTRMLSLSVTIGLLGAIYGGGPLNYLCETLDYKTVVTIFAGIGVLLSILTYAIVPHISSTKHTAIWADLIAVLTNMRVLGVCIFAGLMLGPLDGFADVWGTGFLKNVYGLEGTLAASLPSAIFIGMCFGAPVLSLIAEKTNSYLGVIIASALIMGGSFFALVSGKMPIPTMGLTFILVGVCCAYQIIAIYKASTYVEEHIVGLTTAVANMIIMLFGYFFHSVIGLVVNNLGGPMDANALIGGITVIPVATAIAAVGFIIMALQDKARRNRAHSD